jgi:hypothetical protein
VSGAILLDENQLAGIDLAAFAVSAFKDTPTSLLPAFYVDSAALPADID